MIGDVGAAFATLDTGIGVTSPQSSLSAAVYLFVSIGDDVGEVEAWLRHGAGVVRWVVVC